MAYLIQIKCWSTWSRRKRLVFSLVVGTLLLFISIHLYFRSHPDGIYIQRGPHYTIWAFENGQYYWYTTLTITHDFEKPGPRDITVRPYTWDHGAWDCVNFRMKSSFLGATFIDEIPAFHPDGKQLIHVRFVPRKWYFDVQQWSDKHLHTEFWAQ